MLNQLGHIVYFRKQGRQASFLLETQQNGEANLNLRFHLPKPHSTVSASHPTQPNEPIPPLFPNGQIPRPHNTHPQQKSHPPTKRSPSYYHRNHRRLVLYNTAKAAQSYRQEVLHKAEKAAQNLPPPPPNSLRELANRVLEERNRQPQQSTPDLSRKIRRSSSSPPTIRNCLIVEEVS